MDKTRAHCILVFDLILPLVFLYILFVQHIYDQLFLSFILREQTELLVIISLLFLFALFGLSEYFLVLFVSLWVLETETRLNIPRQDVFCRWLVPNPTATGGKWISISVAVRCLWFLIVAVELELQFSHIDFYE